MNNAYKKFIEKFAEDENISIECAYYYARKFFNFHIEIKPDDNGMPKEALLVPEWKSPEQILEESDEFENPECEKEITGRVKQ